MSMEKCYKENKNLITVPEPELDIILITIP